jgi:glycosyltransferase involved in cell wall biosynthesis
MWGLSGAIKAGMRYANYYGYDYVVQIDGDGQHDPKYIASMAELMEETGVRHRNWIKVQD